MKKKTKRWSVSFLVSFIFLLCTIGTIYYAYKSPLKTNELKSSKQSIEYIKEAKKQIVAPNKADYFIPTGIYLESLTLISTNTVKAVGFIWQHLDIKMPDSASGFLLPNAYNVKTERIYKNTTEGKHFIVWHFEASFFKKVDAVMYPYDVERISFPILSKSLKHNIILIPDMPTYNQNHTFKNLGVSPKVVMKSFFVNNSYFDYDLLNYEPRFTEQSIDFNNPMPILRLNVILKRLSIPPTITTITPMIFTLIITFFVILSISNTVDDIDVKGTTYNDVLVLLSFLIFIVVLAHQSFRSQILGNKVVFLDLICYTLYFSLFYAACLSYIRFIRTNIHFIQRLKEDHYLYPKLFFLPMVFGLLFIGTLCLYLLN